MNSLLRNSAVVNSVLVNSNQDPKKKEILALIEQLNKKVQELYSGGPKDYYKDLVDFFGEGDIKTRELSPYLEEDQKIFFSSDFTTLQNKILSLKTLTKQQFFNKISKKNLTTALEGDSYTLDNVLAYLQKIYDQESAKAQELQSQKAQKALELQAKEEEANKNASALLASFEEEKSSGDGAVVLSKSAKKKLKDAQKAQALAAEKETQLDNYLADYPFVTKEDLLARIDSGLAGGETFQNISSSRLQEILKNIGSEDAFKSEGVRQLAQQFQDILLEGKAADTLKASSNFSLVEQNFSLQDIQKLLASAGSSQLEALKTEAPEKLVQLATSILETL